MASSSRSRSDGLGFITTRDRTLSPAMTERPLVSIVMPVRNEGGHIMRALDAIGEQTYPQTGIEVLVVDGGSTDRTMEVVRERLAVDDRIRILGGPGVNTPLAMELGTANANGSLIAKVDGHGWINDEFIEAAVNALAADDQLGCVGGVIQPVAENDVERGIAIARFSRFGVGGGIYTLSERPQDTETVQCGVYRIEALRAVGGFDPGLPYGEDEELNYRIRRHGWRIRYEPAMRFSYRVRPSTSALFRQYFRYGAARVAVVRKHPHFLRLKHVAPAGLVVSLLGSVPLGLVPGWRAAPGTLWLAYVAFVATGAVVLGAQHRFRRVDLIGRSLIALHFGYGLGTVRGILALLGRPRSSGRGK